MKFRKSDGYGQGCDDGDTAKVLQTRPNATDVIEKYNVIKEMYVTVIKIRLITFAGIVATFEPLYCYYVKMCNMKIE